MVFISFLFDRSQMLITLSRPELELLFKLARDVHVDDEVIIVSMVM